MDKKHCFFKKVVTTQTDLNQTSEQTRKSRKYERSQNLHLKGEGKTLTLGKGDIDR